MDVPTWLVVVVSVVAILVVGILAMFVGVPRAIAGAELRLGEWARFDARVSRAGRVRLWVKFRTDGDDDAVSLAAAYEVRVGGAVVRSSPEAPVAEAKDFVAGTSYAEVWTSAELAAGDRVEIAIRVVARRGPPLRKLGAFIARA